MPSPALGRGQKEYSWYFLQRASDVVGSELARVKPGGTQAAAVLRQEVNEWILIKTVSSGEADPDHLASTGEAREPHLSSERKPALPHNPLRVYFSSEPRMAHYYK